MVRTVTLRADGREYRVVLTDDPDATRPPGRVIGEVRDSAAVAGIVPAVAATLATDGTVRLGESPARTAWVAGSGDARWVFLDGEVYRFEVARDGGRKRSGAPVGSLSAPMPATVVRIQVAPGDDVIRGQTLIVLEAMKMELPVRSPGDGTVAAVHCRLGDLVQPGVTLIDITAPPAPEKP